MGIMKIGHAVEQNALLTDADIGDIIRIGKGLSKAIALESEDMSEVFSKVKITAAETKNVFTKLRENLDHNDFAEVAEKADRIGKLLENNEIIGREVKTVVKVTLDLIKDVVAISGAVLAGNFGALPAAATDTAIDLVYAGKLMVQGAHAFKGYYKATLKPKLHKMKIKLSHKEDKIKDDFKHMGKTIDKKLDKAEHWFEHKLHVKHKDLKESEPLAKDDDFAFVELDPTEELVAIHLDI